MPVFTLYAQASVRQMMDAVAQACKTQGFGIDDERGSRMTISTGSFALSIILGALVLYAHVEVKVTQEDHGEVKATFEYTSTWWQGIAGAWRTNSAIKVLVDDVEKDIKMTGGKVVERKDP
jgi:hypothetical protein